LSKEKRPRRAIAGAVLGILGGLWALTSFLLVGAFIVGGALGGSGILILLGFLSWILPPTVAILSIIASVLMLIRRYRAGGIINVVGSLLILAMFLLLLAGAPSANLSRILSAAIFFWIGPSLLLLTSGILGLKSDDVPKTAHHVRQGNSP